MITVRPLPVPEGPRPRVSVVVPCYNYGRYLPACLDSVLSQEGVDVDVTVVDDASTDDSVEVARRRAATDPRVRVVLHAGNQGHIATFNEALAAASAPYVVKMDADDLLVPGALARATALLESFPQTSFVFGYVRTFTDEVPRDLPTDVRSWSVWSGQEWIDRLAHRGHNVIMQPEIVLRRSALDQVGGHRAELPETSDLNLWLRLASVGSVGRVNGPVQGLYRVHDQSMQRTVHAGFLSDLRGRARAFDGFLAESADRVERPEQVARTVHRTLARDAVRLAHRAYDTGAQATEPVAAYLDLAAGLDPSVARTPAWAGLRVRSAWSGAPVLGTLVRHSPGALAREVQDRVRWRRWRRYGT
ncbi:glycosyl transferase [Actinomycetota bacterium]|nr:glycosyl transferase [Actinomycetota bacterium]